jgi:hypothetical protein
MRLAEFASATVKLSGDTVILLRRSIDEWNYILQCIAKKRMRVRKFDTARPSPRCPRLNRILASIEVMTAD